MVCPYNKFIPCPNVDTSGMDKLSCEKCEACIKDKNRIKDLVITYYSQHNLHFVERKKFIASQENNYKFKY